MTRRRRDRRLCSSRLIVIMFENEDFGSADVRSTVNF
jgi:hypothetical protein